MKKVMAFIISIVIAYTPSLVFASAAEKWDLNYQVDRNNKVLKVTGHQVDKYGDASNDKSYKKDYKFSSSKIQVLTKTSLKGRILRNPQLAVGSAALTAFLAYMGYEFFNGGWYKPSNADVTFNDYDFWSGTVGNRKCTSSSPGQVATCALSPEDQYRTYTLKPYDYSNINKFPSMGFFQHPFTSTHKTNGTVDDLTFSIYYAPKPGVQKPNPNPTNKNPDPITEKDIDSIVADAPNNPNFPWDDVFKDPDVKKEIESDFADSASREVVTKPELDSDGNPTGNTQTEIPRACEWFSTLCDWLEWTKQDPENTEPDPVEIQEKDFDTAVFSKDRFSVSRSCPLPEVHSLTITGHTVQFSFDLTPVCTVAELARPALIACSYLYAAYIVIGAARNG
mgnify:CR=1 FL=1